MGSLAEQRREAAGEVRRLSLLAARALRKRLEPPAAPIDYTELEELAALKVRLAELLAVLGDSSELRAMGREW
jgi:hypothetical protein